LVARGSSIILADGLCTHFHRRGLRAPAYSLAYSLLRVGNPRTDPDSEACVLQYDGGCSHRNKRYLGMLVNDLVTTFSLKCIVRIMCCTVHGPAQRACDLANATLPAKQNLNVLIYVFEKVVCIEKPSIEYVQPLSTTTKPENT
jgi:hypothetical protein